MKIKIISGTLLATFCALLTVSVLISCEEASSSSNGEEAPGAIIANQTRKRADTDIRDSYGIFTIKTDSGSYTDYHLAVKEASETAPTATEMASGALKRNISKTEIHVLIAQRMNAPMVTFAEAYFADNTKKTLGTGMAGSFDDDKDGGSVYDATATGTAAWVKESVLKSETEYALYGMPDGGTEVSKLLTFTTDAMAAQGSTGVADNLVDYIDSTLERGHITIAVNPAERYIFPVHYDTDTGLNIAGFHLEYSNGINAFVISSSTFRIFGGTLPLGYKNLFYLARNRAGGTDPTADDGLKAYVLIDTTDLTGDFWYGSTIALQSGANPAPIYYSTLSPQ